MTDSQSEFSFSSKIKENSQTEQSKFPQLKELRKEILRISTWYLRIKQEVYSWPESKSL